MEVLAVLTFLTVAFLFVRSKYRASALSEYASGSQREYIIRAGDILQDRGYRIVDERIAHEIASFYGAKKFVTYTIVDFLAEKDGVVHPVKVRSPRDPNRLTGVWLRRYLLPLYILYDTPVVYVMPDTETIELVDFSLDYPGRYYRVKWRGRLLWLIAGVVLGWLLAAVHGG